MSERVVITGIGIYSCIGKDLQEVTTSLQAGSSGIIYDKQRKDLGYRSCLTGMVAEPDLKAHLSRRQRVSMGQEAGYAYVATREAMDGAGIDQDFFDTHEVGLIYGNDSTAKSVVESLDKVRQKRDTSLVGSGAIFKAMNSTVNMNLSTIFRLRGINYTVSAACASGSHAIGNAYLFIKHGLQKMVIAGGAQEINPYGVATFDGLGVFSMNSAEPTRACRPFDAGRDGLVPSGGAATLIIESYSSAKERGANILAEVVGYGFSSNGEHISTPNAVGPARAMEIALQQAGMAPEKVDYINAHATSTPIGDAMEAQAIHNVFSGCKPWVSSTKSMTGHECWMAGASEIVYSLLMMKNGFIAPNINLEDPDEHAIPLNLAKTTVESDIDVILSNSFGFGGTNSALIVKKV